METIRIAQACSLNRPHRFGSHVYILVSTQFKLRDDSFERLQLCNFSQTTDYMRLCTNRPIVTSQMNDRMI